MKNNKWKTIIGIILIILVIVLLLLNRGCYQKLEHFLDDGIPVSVNEFPYQVALVSQITTNKAECGGVIINSEFILTAAHCFDGISASSMLVYSGDVSLDSNGTYSTIKKIYKYKYFNRDTGKTERYLNGFYENDLCLIQLYQPLNFDSKTEAIEYISDKERQQLLSKKENGILLGWEKKNLFSSKDKLSKKEIKILDSTECSKGNLMKPYLKSKMLCLGNDAQVNACKGDSGSGVFYKSINGYKLLGIITIGTADSQCNSSLKKINYDILMDVKKYQDWINEIINKNSIYDNFSV